MLVARKLFGCVARSWREAQARRRLARIQEQRKRELARRAAAAMSAGEGEATVSGSGAVPTAACGAAASSEGGGEQYEEERMAGTCVVCIDRQVEVVFTSCGHMCCCERCGSKLNRCPVCRLRGTPIKVYRP